MKLINSNRFLLTEVTLGRKCCSEYISRKASVKDCSTVAVLDLE